MRVRRGGIYWCDLEKAGAPMKKQRPVLVVQNEAGNRFSPYTIVVAIHHDTAKAIPVCVRVPQGVGNLTKDSIIDCGHVSTVPLHYLISEIGLLPDKYIHQVNQALKISFELP